MLSKLYYYEARYYAKISWPIAVAVVVATVAAILSSFIPIDFVSSILFMPYPMVIVAAFCITSVIVVVRFYSHLFTLQGYLSFTLPVRPMDHFVCKLVNAVVFNIIIVALNVTSILLVSSIKMQDTFILKELIDFLVETPGIYWVSALISMMVQGLFSLVLFYTAICIGQLTKNKIITSVVAWFGLNYGSQIINIVLFLLMIFAMSIGTGEAFGNMVSVENHLVIYMIFFSAVYLVECVLAIFTCRYIMTKKLNLE